MRRHVLKSLVAVAGIWLSLRTWAAIRPTAFPYFARLIIQVPRPFITRRRLLEILEPTPGERMLEVGPGTGYYTLPVAARLASGGTLEVLDVRQRFLDHTMAQARAAGLTNVVTRLGDGGALVYPDGSFDAAFLVTVLGEIPNPEAALSELRRVLKPTGRLVVGETLIDPDFCTPRWLVENAAAAGLRLERRVGTLLGYFAIFTPTVAPTSGPATTEAAHAAER